MASKRCTKSFANELLAFMDGDPGYLGTAPIDEASRQRIESLLFDLLHLRALVIAKREKNALFLSADIDKMASRIDRKLSGYTSIVHVCRTELESGAISFQERVASDTYPALEGRMARIIIDLMLEGELSKLDLCRCGNLYFQSRKDNTSCSEACRRAKVESSEERKAWRRNYYRRFLGKSGIEVKRRPTATKQQQKPLKAEEASRDGDFQHSDRARVR